MATGDYDDVDEPDQDPSDVEDLAQESFNAYFEAWMDSIMDVAEGADPDDVAHPDWNYDDWSNDE